MKIAKSEEERELINRFTTAMREALNDELYESMAPLDLGGMNIQKAFEIVKEEIFVASGSLYLCFTCGNHMPRKDVKKQQFFQVSGVWHNCLGEMNGYVVPTAGVITRWKIVADYIQSVSEEVDMSE